MLIENLSKEIETKAMTAVRGGSTGFLNNPELSQINALTYAPVITGNSGDVQVIGDQSGSNKASQPNSMTQLQGLFVGYPWSRAVYAE